MRWWLVRDAVRRQIYPIVTVLLTLTVFWTQVAKDRMVAIAVIGSMIATFTLGGLIAMATMTMREIRLRPISRPAVWQATWMLSVIVAPLIVALGKLVAGFAIWMSNGNVAFFASLATLSSLYDVLFAGLMFGALMLARLMPTPRSTRMKRVVINVWPFACVLLFFPGGWLLPVLANQYLPRAWTSMTWSTALLLLAAGGVGVAAWFGTAPAPSPSVIAHLRGGLASPATVPPKAGAVTGWPVVAWLELRFLLMLIGTAAALAMTMLVFDSTAKVVATLEAIVRHLFDPARPTGDFSLYFVAAACVGSMATSNLLQPMLRQLRALPVSRFRLTATLLLIPILHVAVIWVVLTAIYVISQHAWPPILRLEIYALTTGIAVFSQALQLRFPARGMPLAAILIAPGVMFGWRLILGPEAHAGDINRFAAAATLTSIAMGVALTLYCLRRAATYRPVLAASPWGVPSATRR